MRNGPFKITVEAPANEWDHGKIIMDFMQPRIYFAYNDDYRLQSFPKSDQHRYRWLEMKRAFLKMVESELDLALPPESTK